MRRYAFVRDIMFPWVRLPGGAARVMRAGEHIDYDAGAQRGHYCDGTSGGPTGGTGFRIDARVFAGLLRNDRLGLHALEEVGPVCDEACGGGGAFAEVMVLDEVVGMHAPAASWDLPPIPAGAVIISVELNLQDAISSSQPSIVLGIGVADDPVKYGKTASLSANQKINTVPDWAVLEEDVQLFAVDTDSGAAVGTIGGGAADEVRVRIVYLMPGFP